MNFPYRLAVFDMDDTLLGPDRTLGRENAEALQRLRGMGVEVVIATGRHFTGVVPFEAELGFKSWVISAGGSVITQAATQEQIYELTVPHDIGVEMFHRARGEGISLIGYHRTGIFCDAPSPWIDLYTRRTHQVPIADIPELIGTGLQKLIWIYAATRIKELTPLIQQEFANRLYAVNTEHEMLEIMNPAANKANATRILAERLCIAREEIIAFGDGNNDVPLLQWAGMSVAMAHGRESARQAAKKISPPGPRETAVARSLAQLLGGSGSCPDPN